MMAKETAEQKLLKLIEKTDAQEQATSAPAAAPVNTEVMRVYDSVRGVGQTGIALPPLVSDFIRALKNMSSGDKLSQGFGLREINMVLTLGLVMAVIFFSFDFSRGIGRMEEENALSLHQDDATLREMIQDMGDILPVFQGIQEYAGIVARRNIFQPFERKVVPVEGKTAEEELGISRVSEQIKDFKLVGISWLDSPESASALVENTISGVTYFLRQGERVNEVTIQEIYAESIIVSYQGEEMEMKL